MAEEADIDVNGGGELIGTREQAIEWAYPRRQNPPQPQTWVRKIPLSNWSQPMGDWRKCQKSTLADCEMMQWTIVQRSLNPKWENADRAQHVRSSSGRITTVVMTLFIVMQHLLNSSIRPA